MTSTLPPPRGTRQPVRTALRLSLEDEARTLRHHLREGAQWLMRDVREGAGRLEQAVPLPRPVGQALPSLQHLVDSAAQATGLVFQSAQNAAAVVVASDAAFRRLHFPLQPLAAYVGMVDSRHPSRLFTNTFYWLIRRALQAAAQPALLVRRRHVDAAWWALAADRAAQGGTPVAAGAEGEEGMNQRLAAAVFEALARAHPVRDADRMPWAPADGAELPPPAAAAIWDSLLAATLAVALVVPARDRTTGWTAAQCLQLALQLVRSHRQAFAEALRAAPAEGSAAVAREIAFVLRHV